MPLQKEDQPLRITCKVVVSLGILWTSKFLSCDISQYSLLVKEPIFPLDEITGERIHAINSFLKTFLQANKESTWKVPP
jgi:hypothetical protein